MRVYEFSKISGMPTKELIRVLSDAGFSVKSHMTVLENDALEFLKKKTDTKSPSESDVAAKSSPASVDVQASEALQNGSVQKNVNNIQKSSVVHVQKQKQQTLNVKQPSDPSKSSHFASIEKPVIEKKVSSVEHHILSAPQTVGEFASAAEKQVGEVILSLLRLGIAASKNQLLTEDTVLALAKLYELPVVKPPNRLSMASADDQIALAKKAAGQGLITRLPVIVVVGHVDHGKTTLLDFIRKTRVAAREKGGITQHLGAYQVHTKHGDIVFLDTPGHEAFSKMRQRGVRIADIVILVVAADDGVMPQTVEAIKHARLMDVPIVVAINKADKVPKERFDVIKRQLAQHDILVEDWGGTVIAIPISAKTGQGVDLLLEMIALQAELMDLRANAIGAAKGFVLESHVQKGLGPVATLIIQHGTLAVGDYFSCGTTQGKVMSIVNSSGKRLVKVEPSIPVQVSGFTEIPNASDFFQVMEKQDYKKSTARTDRAVTSKQVKEGAYNFIIKTDTNSSKEALLESLEDISEKSTKGFNIIYAAAGDINESDVELAFNVGAEIIGLHVKAEQKAILLAQRKKVSINLYDIIYRLLEALELKAQGQKEVVLVRTKIGEARVLKVFDIKNIGVVAGCIVLDGKFSRDGTAVVWRGTQKIGEGKIASLQREKRTVKEVHTGFECGFIIEGVSDWKPDDRVECYMLLADTKK